LPDLKHLYKRNLKRKVGQGTLVATIILVSTTIIIGLAVLALFSSQAAAQRENVNRDLFLAEQSAKLTLYRLYSSGNVHVVQIARTEDTLLKTYLLVIGESPGQLYIDIDYDIELAKDYVVSMNDDTDWELLPSSTVATYEIYYRDPRSSSASYSPLSAWGLGTEDLYELTIDATPRLLKITINDMPEGVNTLWLIVLVKLGNNYYSIGYLPIYYAAD